MGRQALSVSLTRAGDHAVVKMWMSGVRYERQAVGTYVWNQRHTAHRDALAPQRAADLCSGHWAIVHGRISA
jgi:hypothetical protein